MINYTRSKQSVRYGSRETDQVLSESDRQTPGRAGHTEPIQLHVALPVVGADK